MPEDFYGFFYHLDYAGIMNNIHQRMKADPEGGRIRMIVLVFGKPPSKVFTETIAENITYWHYRSGDFIDFYSVGFYKQNKDGWRKNGPDFELDAFINTVNRFEEESLWRYSGDTDLVFINAVHDPGKDYTYLDFDNIYSFALEGMLEDKLINSVESYFEKIIAVAKANYGKADLKTILSAVGRKGLLKESLFLALGLLPKNIGDRLSAYLRSFARVI